MGKLDKITASIVTVFAITIIGMAIVIQHKTTQLHRMQNYSTATVFCEGKNPGMDESLNKFMSCVGEINNLLNYK